MVCAGFAQAAEQQSGYTFNVTGVDKPLAGNIQKQRPGSCFGVCSRKWSKTTSWELFWLGSAEVLAELAGFPPRGLDCRFVDCRVSLVACRMSFVACRLSFVA